jgi:hypothetical protein
MSGKIALACVTDIHFNEQNYSKIDKIIRDLCMKNEIVIFAINGDLVSPLQPAIIDGDNIKIDQVFLKYGTKEGLNNFQNQFLIPLSKLTNLFVVFNLGNHEIMKKRWNDINNCFQKLKHNFGEKFQVVTNLQFTNPMYQKLFGQKFVDICGIKFVGYLTTDFIPGIHPGKETNDYEDNQKENLYDMNGGEYAHYSRLVQNIKTALSSGPTKCLVLLAHEGRKEFEQKGAQILKEQIDWRYVSQKVIVVGHNHGIRQKFGPYDFKIQGFPGLVVAPISLGNSVEVVSFDPTNKYPKLESIGTNKV